MKNMIKTLIELMTVVCGVLLIIHRRVIADAVTGSPIPEMPEWHRKLLCCKRKEKEA